MRCFCAARLNRKLALVLLALSIAGIACAANQNSLAESSRPARRAKSERPPQHTAGAGELARIKRSYEAGEYEQVIRLTSPPFNTGARGCGLPDFEYYRGMALAKLKRWVGAESAFQCGRRKAPHDQRFPTELGGVEFLEGQYGAAKRYLREAVRIDPQDDYANTFLASLYALDDNLPAAIKYWNRAGKPVISAIHVAPQKSVDPLILPRALAFSPGTKLDPAAFSTTQALLDSLGVFSHRRIELQPLASGQFNANLSLQPKAGLGSGKLEDALRLLRGTPYETIYPEWFNIRHRAINFTSLLRWDPNKERINAAISAPISGNPRWRYRLYLDGRRENWNISRTFFAAPTPVDDMQMEKLDAGAEIESIVSGRLQWTMGLDLSGRTFRNVQTNSPQAAAFFRNGFALEYRAGVSGRLFGIPEKRFRLDGGAASHLGRRFARGLGAYWQGQAGVKARWLPRARGDDYEMTAQFRAGDSLGKPPFDNLFILGLERDNNLWLRAHIGTEDGRKGAAPLGRKYELANWDDFKTIYSQGFFSLRLGPFFDAGKISDPTGDFGSRRWLFDTGIVLKVRVLGSATVELFFGKNLRTGRNAFYGTTAGY
ncbi:MAG: tetratricopeptide repeat protein [Acidobacteriota bacterium]|nr:tetratricopeptide repeat protein [Acidobacteriota bacterium]